MADKETSMGDASSHGKKALTSAERVKRFRSKRVQQDPSFKAQESLRVEGLRKKRVAEMDEAEKTQYQKKGAERVAKCRQRKKELKALQQHSTPTPRRKGFKTKQALSKAVNKVLFSFPGSPSKKLETFSGVASHISTTMAQQFMDNLNSKRSANALDEESVDIIKRFYENTDIVWTNPGMKEEMTVWENGTKKKLRKLYLTMYLKEAHKLFQNSYPHITVGFSKFCSLRPKNVLLLKDQPSDQCKCQKHENFMLMLKGLEIYYSNEFWENCLCESTDLNGICWKGECEVCKNGGILYKKVIVKDRDVFWKVWEKDENGRLRLGLKNGCFGQLLEIIIKELPDFQQHVRIKRIQADSFNTDKADPNTSTLQCDFAMAYSCEYQQEVQSALWSRESVNLFTAAFYHGGGACQSCLIVTNSQDKGKNSVFSFLNNLVLCKKQHLKRQLIIYTDGPSSEFKNRYCVKLLSLLNQKLSLKGIDCCVSWKYFATSHGKGVVDGIGGSAKSLVRRKVMSRDGEVVQSSLDFARVASQAMPNVYVQHVSQNDIDNFIAEENPWENVEQVSGISKVHCMIGKTSGDIQLQLHNNGEVIGSVYTSTSEPVIEGTNNGLAESVNKNNLEVNVGDWVLVTYDGKNYPGEVTGKNEESVRVNVMRPTFTGNWKWPEIKDEIYYDFSHVLKCIGLPVPIGSRGQFKFQF